MSASHENDNEPAADQPQEAQEAAGEAERIAALEAEAAKYKDQWVRAVADTENLRKRAERDQQETSKYAISAFARDMVSVLENLTRASESIPPEKRSENDMLKTLGEGVDLTRSELLSIFERHGIRRIHPIGEKFDHNFHQAVVQVDAQDVEPGTVV